jgi:uncharacterized protein (TIGR03067 family)
MMLRYLVPLSLGVFLATSATADDAKKDELQGNWVATSWKRGDAEVGKDAVATELTIKQDTYEFPKGINRISKKGKFKIDAAKGTIDFMPEDGPAAGKSLLGVYKVEGDTLKLCFTSAGRERPKDLRTADRSTVLATYEKKK